MRKVKGEGRVDKGAAGCQAVAGTAGGAKSSPSLAPLDPLLPEVQCGTMWWCTTFGRLMFLLSVVGGHSPKVKCREDSFVFKGEASLLFNLLLCFCHCPPMLRQCVHLLQCPPLVLTERCHQQLVPGSIPILYSCCILECVGGRGRTEESSDNY